MGSIFCRIDDKHVPLFRIVWVSDLPHFCGSDECDVEGLYEIRLEQGEALFASREERDQTLEALEKWGLPEGYPEDLDDDGDPDWN
ncbi:MAG: hypothetical protein QGG36_28150 [Pirellulaceae bacterium]|jgi:hypothetical protein|nr:hypothetical protein [Pirellulaceae bacterium]MDP7019702.1 hypothetical protein [Pirellulaceae bacterium]